MPDPIQNQDYISGENSAEAKIPMTAPVIFRQATDGRGWQVSFFCPSSFEDEAAIPVPKVRGRRTTGRS